MCVQPGANRCAAPVAQRQALQQVTPQSPETGAATGRQFRAARPAHACRHSNGSRRSVSRGGSESNGKELNSFRRTSERPGKAAQTNNNTAHPTAANSNAIANRATAALSTLFGSGCSGVAGRSGGQYCPFSLSSTRACAVQPQRQDDQRLEPLLVPVDTWEVIFWLGSAERPVLFFTL